MIDSFNVIGTQKLLQPNGKLAISLWETSFACDFKAGGGGEKQQNGGSPRKQRTEMTPSAAPFSRGCNFDTGQPFQMFGKQANLAVFFEFRIDSNPEPRRK